MDNNTSIETAVIETLKTGFNGMAKVVKNSSDGIGNQINSLIACAAKFHDDFALLHEDMVIQHEDNRIIADKMDALLKQADTIDKHLVRMVEDNGLVLDKLNSINNSTFNTEIAVIEVKQTVCKQENDNV